jgi:hypothetical protein
MGFIFGIIVLIGTVAFWGLAKFAEGMSDAPGQSSGIGMPFLLTGIVIGAALIGSHYFPVSW